MEELQKRIKEFTEKHGLKSPGEHHVLDLLSELGELAKEILKSTNYGRDAPEYDEDIGEELGDVTYSLITLANYYGVNLEKELLDVLEKYERRMRKGSAGSEMLGVE